MVTEQAKAKVGEGQNEDAKTPPPEDTPEPEDKGKVVKPKPEDSEGKKGPEDFEQKYKTLVGQQQKLQKDYDELKGAKTDFSGVAQKIGELTTLVQQQGETLNLHTEILSAGAEYNEDMQGRIKKAREAQEARTKYVAEAQEAMAKITKFAKTAGVDLEDEILKPAKEAYAEGKPQDALNIATLALIAKSSAVRPGEPQGDADKDKQGVDKDKLKQLTTTSRSAPDWESLSPTEKIKRGLEERDKNK